MKTIKERKLTITINRPDGTTEIVDITKKRGEEEAAFIKYVYPKMVEETKKAGRGEIVGYEYIAAEYEKEEEDYIEHCEKCGKKVDTRTAYGQMEWTRFSGQKMKVKAFYCDDCRDLLGQIGIGEVTVLEERAAHVPSREMKNKEELA